MKNSGLKNEQKVQELLTKGSTALADKNSAGVRLFKESDLGDGIISGKLIRPKYNNSELKKSIDTEIFELLPQEAPQLPDMVLRSVYNTATQSINDLTLQVQQLNTEVGTLNSKISELEIVSESLKIEADNQILKANISEQQSMVANEQVATTTIDLSNAIQNSINEAIQRVSLTARNQSLEQETENLREQLFGLAAQTAEGASSGANNKFTVKINGSAVDSEGSDISKATSHNGYNGDTMGVTLEVNNVTADNKITNITFNVIGTKKWFKVQSGATSIEPQLSETYTMQYDKNVIAGMDPYKKSGWFGIKYWSSQARDYRDTDLEIKVTFADGTDDSLIFTTHLRKNRG
jgi:hypothetical protein